MRLLTYAIASIVDANTGYGLHGSRHFVDPRAAVQRAHRIRSNSVHALAGSIRAAIGARIEGLRARLQERRDLKQLIAMNDHLLRDIGLSRGDLIAVELGKKTLAEIYAERRAARGIDGTARPATSAATAAFGHTGEAANEEDYQAQKCA